MLCPHCQAANANDARFCGACGKTMQSTEPVSSAKLGEPVEMIGRVIAGRYRIQSKLGEGGMGAVYRAEQISLKRACAVKLLRPELSASPMLLRRFNAEAEAVAKLKHPNTVHVYDFGQDADGTLFIAMEFVEGRSLRSVVQAEAPLPLRRALKIAAQVAASLTNAHGKSIVHRDLKPDNVMLHDAGRDRDNVTVLDFGIAKLRDDTRGTQMQMTQAGDMLGTPQYMSPEQIRAEAIDGRTDVYALGCMLYEMFTGRLPFEGPTVMALLSKHLLEQAVPPSQRRPDLQIPPMIDELVMLAMAKDPAHRPPTMEAYGERIAAILAALPSDTTAAMSAVHGVPSAPVPTPPVARNVPTAYTGVPSPALFVPHSPPPGVAPPPALAPPVPYPTPAPVPYPMQPAGTPQAAPSPFAAPRRSAGPKLALIAIAVAVLGGGGFAAYHFATKKSPPAATPGSDDPPSAHEEQPGSAHEPHDDDDDDKPAAPGDDPWGGDPAGPSAGPQIGMAGNALLPAGARLVPPAGFTYRTQPAAQIVVNPKTAVLAAMFAVPGTETDPDALAREWVKLANVKFEGKAQATSHGEPRFVLGFSGMNGRVPMRQVVVLYFSESYRLAVLVTAPARGGRDPFASWLAPFLEHNVVLPAS